MWISKTDTVLEKGCQFIKYLCRGYYKTHMSLRWPWCDTNASERYEWTKGIVTALSWKGNNTKGIGIWLNFALYEDHQYHMHFQAIAQNQLLKNVYTVQIYTSQLFICINEALNKITNIYKNMFISPHVSNSNL